MWLFRSGLFLLAYAGINIYTGVRIFTLVKYFFPSFRAFVFWPLFILFCYSFVFVMLLRFSWLRPFRQTIMNSLPVLFYLFSTLLVLDAARFVLQRLGRIPYAPVYSAAVTGIAIILALLVMVYGVFHARNIYTTQYTVTLNKSEGGLPPLRIVLVSDTHIGTAVGQKWIANVVDAINKANPDMICIAGDIFDNDIGAVRNLEGIAEELRRLNAPMGVYACPGNHDVDRLSLRGEGGTDRIRDFLKTANIGFLQDEVVVVANPPGTEGNQLANNIHLIGRKDARPIGIRGERKTAVELADGLDRNKPLIFLDHQPVDFPAEEEAGADLILSGHTHKGQFFPGNVFTRQIFKNAGAVHYGHWKGRSAQGVVSSGAGVWGPPIRVATRSEIAVIDITFGE